MYLDPEWGEVEVHTLHLAYSIVSLQHHKMFIETPWFICKYVVHFGFIVKSKENYMVPKILNFETIFGSPQRCKSGRNGVDVQGSLCKELSNNDEHQCGHIIMYSKSGALLVQDRQTSQLFCEIFHQR